MPRRTIWSVLAAALLCLVMLPVTALASAPNGQVIFLGDETVTSDGYWTTDDNGNVTAYSGEGAPADNYIHYDTADNTLTLHNAIIRESVPSDTDTHVMGAAIGVFHQNGAAELTIQLEGTNTIAEVDMGIYVLASSVSDVDASLTITGNGSLDASGSQNGIQVQSSGGDATLGINGAEVKAEGDNYSGGAGVKVQAGSAHNQGHTATLTVNGGKITASGAAGIEYNAGAENNTITTKLSVSSNALVDARDGGIGVFGQGNVAPTVADDATSGGIVWDGKDGAVYGSVTLQGDLTINEGESLDVSDGATLTVPEGVILVNKGTLSVGTGSSLNNNGALGNTGTTTVDGSIQNAGQIVNAEDGAFTGDGTIVNDRSFGHGSFSNLGSVSNDITVSGNHVVNYVTKVTLDSSTLTLVEGETGSLTAQLTPANATYQGVSWASSDENVITVAADPSNTSKAIVTAAGPGTATITAKADNNGDALGNNVFATCSVTVLEQTTITGQPDSISVDAGADATFSVTATGSGSLAYQWQASTDDGDTWADVPGATSPSYTVESVTEDMSGTRYRCVVTGDGSVATSEPATLTVAHIHRPASEWSSDEDGHWYACETCGDKLDYATHTTEAVGERDATCTEDGYTGDTVCSVCGHVIEKGAAIPATDHTWGAWDVTEPATCTEDGLETRACEACGETETRTVPATGHAWGEPAWSWSDDGSSATATFTCKNDPEHVQRPEVAVSSEVLLAPTCTEAGTTRYTATVELGRQTYTSTKDVTDIPATDHSFTSYASNHDATCTEDGTETAACDNGCGATDTRADEGSALGHELERVDAISATCTEPGTREHWECARCDALFADEDGKKPANAEELTIPATGHSPAAAWSSDESGHWHACDNGCGTRLDAAAHEPETTGEKDATCTDEGYTGDTACSVCRHVIAKGETVPTTGHSWGAWDTTEPATCEKDGLETRACEACGEEETRSVPALGHDWGEPEWSWSEDGTSFVAAFACAHDASHVTELMAKPTSEVVSEPICTEPGMTRYYAEVKLDGVTYAAESTAANVPALGHDFENGTCTVCGAKDEGYVAPEDRKDPGQTPEPVEPEPAPAEPEPEDSKPDVKPSDPEPTVPETGDATASFSLALGILGAAALGAGALTRRRG